MIKFDKRVYPEINKNEFDKHIYPLLKSIESMVVRKKEYVFEEQYPYHNSTLLLASNLWNQSWENSLNELLSDYDEFKTAILEDLSNVAFTYFIRCFAEQIKDKEMKFDDYTSYNNCIRDTGYKVFYDRYPVIWYRANNLLNNKLKALVEMLAVFRKDREQINKLFDIEQSAKIKSIKSGGDTHNHGKSVSIVTFDNNQKIIYKPRTVKGEKGYVTLVKELNDKFGTNFGAYKVLDKGDYGFISFVEVDESFTDMIKAGEIACLMYMLNATDMHYSNILWCKEGPVPIDLETLFHIPRIKTGLAESKKSAYAFLENSIFSTGVLPIQLGGKRNSVDVGFTGVRDDSNEGPIKPITITNGFSKDIGIRWSPVPEPKGHVYKADEEKQTFEKCDEIIKGFKKMYKRILKNKELFKEIVESAFEGVKLRYIHNMTYRYEQILRSLSSPQAASDVVISQALLSRVGILSVSSDPQIAVSECEQLWRGDVPYFTLDFESDCIMDEEKVVAHSVASPKENFEKKMDIVSDEDLEKQVRIIRLAFVAKLADPDTEGERSAKEVVEYLADKLSSSVMSDHYDHLPMTWVGPVLNPIENVWTPGVLGYDLYSGRIGPGVALAMAGEQFGNKKYSDIAFQLFDSSAKILDEKKYEIRNLLVAGVGFFSGFTSILWGLNEAGKIMKQEKWCQIAKDAFSIIDNELATVDDNFFDIIAGKTASVILRHRMNPEYRLSSEQLSAYIAAGETRLDNRNEKTAVGFAHGICQIMWFFSVLNQTYRDERITTIIKRVDEVLQKEFVTNSGKFITYAGEHEHMVSSSWCNGLSGILLTYYEGYKAGVITRDRVESVIEALCKSYIPDMPIFCHGALGVEEVLDYISEDFKDETSYIISHLNDGMCRPEKIYKYYEHEKGRYSLSAGFMTGQSGAICFLGKKLGNRLEISPLTLGRKK